jgi:hypothetical protein
VVAGVLNKVGVFSFDGVYDIAIQVNTGGKQYVWSTANVAVSSANHTVLGDVELQETGYYLLSLKFDAVLDSYSVRFSLPGEGNALPYLIETEFIELFSGFSGKPTRLLVLNLPQGTHAITVAAFGELDAVQLSYSPVELLNQDVIPGEETFGGSFTLNRL